MELIRLSEFMRLTRLRPEEVLSMLEFGELVSQRNESGELLVDISSIDVRALAARHTPDSSMIPDSERPLHEEIIATEIVSALEEIIDEALEMALRWHEKSEQKVD